MKKLLFSFIILFFFSFETFSQNLVSNPSFEDYTICPQGTDEVNDLVGWYNFGSSPDYFNSCSPYLSVSVPHNFGGYQLAASGNAYCGIATYVSPVIMGGPNYREYIGGILSPNLIIGTKYYVSYKISLAYDGRFGPANCATDNIGIKFSIVPYNPGNSHITNNAQINTSAIITDTLNWTRLFGSFVSDSAYQYIVIGNFFDDNHTDTLIIDNDSICAGAYYYIDDICVSTDSLYCVDYTYTGINESGKQNNFLIYPNPSTNYINIDFPALTATYDLEIFNAFGNEELKQEIFERHTVLNISNISAGILLIKITLNNQLLFYKLLKF